MYMFRCRILTLTPSLCILAMLVVWYFGLNN